MRAVVLAAGKGERLQPITLTKPKALIPVGGRPLLEHVLSALKSAGIGEVVLVVHYMAEKIIRRFGDGSRMGLKLHYIRQGGVYGTADAIGAAEAQVSGDFLAVYGDLLIAPAVIREVLRTHRGGASATMAVVPVEDPRQYGMVRVEGGIVTGIVEKPDVWPYEKLANAGVYVLNESVFDAIRRTGESKRGEREITSTLQEIINGGGEVLAAQIPAEEWMDVGRPWDLLEANRRVLVGLKPGVDGVVEDGANLVGPVYVAGGARVRAGAYVEGPTLIGADCDVGPNCYIRPYTSLGEGVRIGNACEVKNSIIMRGTHIGHLSYVGDSVIGEDCNLGAGTITANLRFDKRTVRVVMKGELVDSGLRKLGVIMGDGAQTGINATIMPGVKIGPKCWIGPNVVVYRDVPPGTRLTLKQELDVGRVPGG